jgi:hypothetical protein
MSNPVKASANVALEHVASALRMSENYMDLSQGIRATALTTETVRIGIGCRFQDGFQAEQMQSLHGSVGHGGDAQRTKLGRVAAFGNVYPPHRLGVITVWT